MTLILPKRFWDKVNKTETCWLWTAQLSPKGYGVFDWQDRPRRAHRLSYEAATGVHPGALQVDHLCYTRNCVRPDHLQLATNQQNNENRQGANKNSRSGIRGVSWSSAMGKWHVRVHRNGVGHSGGYFDDPKEAEQVAIALRNRLMTNNLRDKVPHGNLTERLASLYDRPDDGITSEAS